MLYSEHWRGAGDKVLKQACQLGMEGIVSKRASAPYTSGRSGDWRKVKCQKRQEFVVVGYTPGSRSHHSLGALLLGYYEEGGELSYAGKVGTGFDSQEMASLLAKLGKIRTKKSPLSHGNEDSAIKKAMWVKPVYSVEVQFQEWTRHGRLRQTVYRGLRQDKTAKAVEREEPTVKEIQFSNPNKVLFSKGSITKIDLADYYRAVSALMLPHIKSRPLSLLRCPDGVGGNCFFQKRLGMEAPGLFEHEVTSPRAKNSSVIYLKSQEGLMSLVQLGALEIHSWGARLQDLLHPDEVVFDLDPGLNVDWPQIVEGARLVRRLVGGLGLESFVKLTGGKGVHVHVPISGHYTWAQIKGFSKTIAQYLCETRPDLFLSKMSKEKRRGKIFVDYLRNGFGATFISPYSLRANAEGAIAVPIAWSHLAKVRANSVTINNFRHTLLHRRKDPWSNYFQIQQTIDILP